MLLSEKIKMTK